MATFSPLYFFLQKITMVSITETTRVNTAPVHLNYTFPVTVKQTLKTVEGTQSFHYPLCNAERGISAVPSSHVVVHDGCETH
jgi:hypothetical protein